MKNKTPKTIKERLAELPGAPSPEQIDKWKSDHGEVQASAFTSKEIFLFRPLTKPEHDSIGHQAAQSQMNGTEFDADRMVIDTCLLWASEEGKSALERKAGTIASLQEQISMVSNFHSAQVLVAMIEEL